MKSKISLGSKTKEGILIHFKMFIHMHGLTVAHVFMKFKDEVIYVRVFNPDTSKVCIK